MDLQRREHDDAVASVLHKLRLLRLTTPAHGADLLVRQSHQLRLSEVLDESSRVSETRDVSEKALLNASQNRMHASKEEEDPYATPVEVLIDQQCARLAEQLSLDDRNISSIHPTANDLLTTRPFPLLNVALAWRRVTIACNMYVLGHDNTIPRYPSFDHR
mmetsp:Transcript_47775/g.120285  ORF Transcript_47775/g.120285 Transcript_47775/m.120285 type:complete len:161 (-) Transcript_47775:127-609(-)